MGEIRKDNLHESLIKELNELANIDLSGKQDKTDESLLTESKDLVGAINELFQSANNGKELIANAIGEPLSSEDTFSAMSTDINGLLSTFKTNMMNNGVTIEANDKFKSLIDKIATLADSEGKGVQFASGVTENVYGSQVKDPSNLSINVPINLDFEPTYFLVCIPKIQGRMGWASYTNLLLSNFANTQTQNAYGGGGTHTLKVTMSDITTSNFLLTIYSSASGSSYGAAAEINCQITWYAIGVGEEDTTLRDSLASILGDKGVDVSDEDDMASLIGKVDNIVSKMPNIYLIKNGLANPDIVGTLDRADVNAVHYKTYEENEDHIYMHYQTGNRYGWMQLVSSLTINTLRYRKICIDCEVVTSGNSGAGFAKIIFAGSEYYTQSLSRQVVSFYFTPHTETKLQIQAGTEYQYPSMGSIRVYNIWLEDEI